MEYDRAVPFFFFFFLFFFLFFFFYKKGVILNSWKDLDFCPSQFLFRCAPLDFHFHSRLTSDTRQHPFYLPQWCTTDAKVKPPCCEPRAINGLLLGSGKGHNVACVLSLLSWILPFPFHSTSRLWLGGLQMLRCARCWLFLPCLCLPLTMLCPELWSNFGLVI